MTIPVDYVTLRIIWWIFLGLLLIGFAVMDGFDLGIGIILPWVAKTDDERRVVLNSIGPVWEGNQIWLILGAGAIFAAWPAIYAVSFSGFYFAMLLVLFALILRPVGFKYRSKLANPTWRHFWDKGLFIAGFVPTLIFGVAIGNVLQGVPFYFDESLRSFYTGSLIGLLNPFALLCGLVSVSMLIMHGGIFLSIKTVGKIQWRAINFARVSSIVTMMLFLIAGYWIVYHLPGYTITSAVAPDGYSNPLHKTVVTEVGAWASNYKHYPWLMLVPILGFVGAIFAFIFLSIRCYKWAWLASAIMVANIITTVGVSMFPFILPSSTFPNMSLLVWDASSSQLTLFIMLIATLIFLPIILAYTSWVFYVLRGKVVQEDIEKNTRNFY